jgi:hypothetical protein
MCASASLPSCKHERGQSREHVSVCRNVLATQPNHSLAIVTGSPSGTTSSSGNIMPNIAACPLVCLSGRITQPWHARERSCVGAPACASTHASARAVTHSQRLFHTRIQPSHRCTSVARAWTRAPFALPHRGRFHVRTVLCACTCTDSRYFTCTHATRHCEAHSSISRHVLWRCSHD